jgi:hypothetical protein
MVYKLIYMNINKDKLFKLLMMMLYIMGNCKLSKLDVMHLRNFYLRI